MKMFYMLIGLPATGKSSFIKNYISVNAGMFGHKNKDYVILSTDDYIEERAKYLGKTYNEVFKSSIKDAEKAMYVNLEEALFYKTPYIIWDQTNLTVATRAKKLALIPDDYFKTAVYFSLDNLSNREYNHRLNSREGKTIPSNVIHSMESSVQPPTFEEGFDSIIDH